MKKYKELERLKTKFALIFTLIIFIIVLIFQIIFTSIRYFNSTKQQFGKINELMKIVDRLEKSGRGINFLNQGLGNRNIDNFNGMRIGQEMVSLRETLKLSHSNIIIKSKNKIDSYIVDDLSYDVLLSILNNNLVGNKIDYIPSGGIIFSINIAGNDYYYAIGHGVSRGKDFQFLVLDKAILSWQNLIVDNIYFMIVMLICSFLIYLLGKHFVGYNMQPVGEKIKEMEDFVHNAGHELKTPLAVMNSGLQLAKEIKNYDQQIEQSLNQIKYMEGLINGLVTLSDLDGIVNYEDINVNEEIKFIIDNLKLRFQEKNINVIINENAKIVVNGNLSYFGMLVTNILNNSIKFTSQNGLIIISIEKNRFIIEDNGIGISKENLKKVFNRFFKEDKSRNTQGYGIGLSLVQKISEIHGWRIYLESEKGKGTKVIVKF